MSEVPDRNTLLEIIDNERAQWDALVAGIPSSAMNDTPVTGDWTFRDLTAHLLAWREWGLVRLDAAARRQPKPKRPYPDEVDSVDGVNVWFHQRDLGRSAEDLVTAYSDSFGLLKTFVAGLSDDDLADPNLFPTLEGQSIAASIADKGFFEHIHVEHGPDIEVWLAKLSTS